MATASTTERRRKAATRKISFGKIEVVTEPGSRFATRVQANLIDRSEMGVCVEVAAALPMGMAVQVVLDGEQWAGTVCWVNPAVAGSYRIGIEGTRTGRSSNAEPDSADDDFYDILQVSPKADFDLIHRVYRMLAQRYHPDHKETGDEAKFHRLLGAYETLSDPGRRAAYDVKISMRRRQRWETFRTREEGDGVGAEKRKRTLALSVMYRKRLRQPESPEVGLRDLEDVLGIEKEHLTFALWYLRERGLMARSDNGRYAITAAGVDAFESAETLAPARTAIAQLE